MDELDIEVPEELVSYLKRDGRISSGIEPRVRNLSGGVSNRTVRVDLPDGTAWVLKQALPKLRVPADWFADPARIHREADGLRWLASVLPPGSVPAFLFEDRRHRLLAMEAVPDPHRNWKEMLLAGEIDDDRVDAFGRLLAAVHRTGRTRRDEASRLFADRSHFETLRLEPYYAYTAGRLPRAARFLEDLVHETRSIRDTVVHGDFSPKNILVHGERLVLLDHEVIHFGDPAFDLGFSLTHFLAKANHLAGRRADFGCAARRYVEAYAEARGAVDAHAYGEFEDRVVRHTAACLLARVAGRSPLEYLTEAGRERQLEAALSLVAASPHRVEDAILTFLDEL